LIQNQATSEDASAAAVVRLPRDVLAGVLLRLPASDLRQFRHVCKEWCEIISDPFFMDEHMDHGPNALTHTSVFFPGSSPCFLNNIRDGYRKGNSRTMATGTSSTRTGESQPGSRSAYV
jgi:hypothetical protein